jgi:hypothetical protein
VPGIFNQHLDQTLPRHIEQFTSREISSPVAKSNLVAFGQPPNAARMVGFVLIKFYDPACEQFFRDKKL